MTPITVAIPVGSRPEHKAHLDDAILSVLSQLETGDELLIVDDGAGLLPSADSRVMTHWNEWRLGDAASHNICVALAKNEHVLWLASDDKLLWGCLGAVRQTIEKHRKERAWYWLDVVYDNGMTQRLVSGPACVTKALWEWSGGYPPDLGAGPCDALFIGALLEHGYGDVFVQVESPVPLYWHRLHEIRARHHDLSGFARAWRPEPWMGVHS